MTEEKPTEVAVEVTKEVAAPVAPEKTITVDLYGESIELPVSKAKAIIAKRDTKTKEYNELKGKITVAESQAKAEAERAQLLESMKKLDADAIEEQVGAKYKDTISRFERKVFNGEITATLAKLGVLPDALPDSVKLVLSDAKPELDGDSIKLNGVAVEEYLKTWVEKKQHLVAVKAAAKAAGKHGPAVPPKPQQSGKERMAQGLNKLFP
jgi:hypothetical protein